jgi:tellurite resistance protein
MFISKRSKKTMLGGGDFFCPQCYQRRQYRTQIICQYVTIMMVRLYRVGEPERSPVCSTCGAVFSEAILDYDPDQQDQQFVAEVLRINVLIAMVEGRLEPAEIIMIQKLHKEIAGNDLSREDIENEVRKAYESELDAADMVRQIGRSLGGEGAKIVAQHAHQVAVATGSISAKRQAQLDRFPAGLGISAAGFQELIDEVSSPTSGGASRTHEVDNQEHDP